MTKYKGWIGVDLDGTLARYDHWRGTQHIGEPIQPMVERVKQWLKNGYEVRIMTARAKDATPEDIEVIKNWSESVFGIRLPVTNEKDMAMVALYDDRAIQVLKNTGVCVISPNAESHFT